MNLTCSTTSFDRFGSRVNTTTSSSCWGCPSRSRGFEYVTQKTWFSSHSRLSTCHPDCSSEDGTANSALSSPSGVNWRMRPSRVPTANCLPLTDQLAHVGSNRDGASNVECTVDVSRLWITGGDDDEMTHTRGDEGAGFGRTCRMRPGTAGIVRSGFVCRGKSQFSTS